MCAILETLSSAKQPKSHSDWQTVARSRSALTLIRNCLTSQDLQLSQTRPRKLCQTSLFCLKLSWRLARLPSMVVRGTWFQSTSRTDPSIPSTSLQISQSPRSRCPLIQLTLTESVLTPERRLKFVLRITKMSSANGISITSKTSQFWAWLHQLAVNHRLPPIAASRGTTATNSKYGLIAACSCLDSVKPLTLCLLQAQTSPTFRNWRSSATKTRSNLSWM